MSLKGIDDVPLFVFSPYPGTEIFRQLVDSDKLKISDDYFLSLTSLNSKYLSASNVVSYNPEISAWKLGLVRMLFTLANYGVGYLFYPSRMMRTLRSILDPASDSVTVFEQRLKDNLKESL